MSFIASARGFLRKLASMRIGLLLFGLVAVAGVAGSLTKGAGEAVYGSWWFAALLGALAINTALCAFTRFPGLARREGRPSLAASSLRGASVFFMHLSIVLLSLASLWASFMFGSEAFRLSRGGEVEVDGRPLVLESVCVERYSDGSVSDWVSVVDWGGEAGELRVNHPLRRGSTKILQGGYGREYSVSLRLPDAVEPEALRVDQGVAAPIRSKDSLAFSVAPPRVRPDLGDAGDKVELSLLGGGKLLQRAEVGIGMPVALGESGIEITVEGSSPYSVFIVRRTPGIFVLWAGFALLALSSCGLLLGGRAASKEGN